MRDISPEEALVVAQALAVAANSPDYVALAHSVASLKVIAVCECGCASIDFHTGATMTFPRPFILADGLGTTRAGSLVGVLVWGNALCVTGLEIYSLSSLEDILLPMTSSIREFQAGTPMNITPN
jgi:hypothetical protein